MQLADRIARSVISVTGIAIIAAVLGIGAFLLIEIMPLLQGASVRPAQSQPAPVRGQPHWALVDEQQQRLGVVGGDPVVAVVSLEDGASVATIPLDGLEGQRITAAWQGLRDESVAFGTDQGAVWIGSVRFDSGFKDGRQTATAVAETEAVVQAAPGHRITALASRKSGDRRLLAAIVDDGVVLVTDLTTRTPLIGPERRTLRSLALPLEGLGQPVAVLVGERADHVLVGTSDGLLTRWHIAAEQPAELVESTTVVESGGVTAMVALLGDRSVVVGGGDGSLATWSLIRDDRSPDGWRITRIHTFPMQRQEVALLAASPRDKGFISVGVDGRARLHYMTSERTLAEWTIGATPSVGREHSRSRHFLGTPLRGAPASVALMTPKANGAVFLDESGRWHHWIIHNPHPEVSWRALFGKVWYEGYERPDYVWQSSGGTDDFEPKLSLVPLAFGTMKGTAYALLFAVPLSIFGALYCSQFLDKHWRAPIKSTIELMAALPSVVLGFVAGVVLAPMVQNHVVMVLSLPMIMPLVTLGGMAVCGGLRGRTAQALLRHHEFWLIVLWLLAGLIVTCLASPWIERAMFGGSFDKWLLRAMGTRYDQRNSLIVGWAMGFAVIPIIFTICEDAFSAVPKHLVGASLACGASRWQTAWHVILPAAGSGVFSAVMIGFGRAIGETMIVLMATGNTPIMDWSIFNGFRALSANIAVEIPEAPFGGTLYRVLFVAALLLFAMTFVVNTAAELVRLRLRRQLQGL